jgi:hypothetical protein
LGRREADFAQSGARGGEHRKQVGLVRVDKSVAYLDIDDTGLAGAGYGPVTP